MYLNISKKWLVHNEGLTTIEGVTAINKYTPHEQNVSTKKKIYSITNENYLTYERPDGYLIYVRKHHV
jgi:hypothetical protein